jgi:mRNA interferase RelE/StbE
MGRYEIRVAERAAKELERLGRQEQRRIVARIERLAEEPRPRGCVKLSGAEDIYRIRIGEYRVLYEVRDALLIVLVLRVRHRRDAYR